MRRNNRHAEKGPSTALIVLTLSWCSFAAASTDRGIEIITAHYRAGQYQQTLDRVEQTIASFNLPDSQRIEVLTIAGLSAFHLDKKDICERYFLRVLELNPDYVLDPFAVPPGAIRFLDDLREKNSAGLDLLRRQIALRASLPTPLPPAQSAGSTPGVAQLRAAGRDLPVALQFLPFGYAQFSQGRLATGVGFATAEAVFVVTSIVAYFAIDSLFQTSSLKLAGYATGTGSPLETQFRHIPSSAETAYRVWSAIKFSTGIAFFVAWLSQIVEQFIHRVDPAAPPPTQITSSAASPRTRIDELLGRTASI